MLEAVGRYDVTHEHNGVTSAVIVPVHFDGDEARSDVANPVEHIGTKVNMYSKCLKFELVRISDTITVRFPKN